MDFLKNKEAKEIVKSIEKQWGAKLDWTDKYFFIINNKEKLFIVNKEISSIEFEKLRIDKLGLYVAEIKDHHIRLSIEGSQMIGPLAKKNLVELDEDQMNSWMQGKDLDIKGDYSGFVILKHEKDYLGTGRYSEGKIFNHVPKSRRIH
ncbi:hypothetical protein HY837_06350 [archaeon]|nr:hypothetical protein [archaeon]